jgi:predicted nucleic acid-binding protein
VAERVLADTSVWVDHLRRRNRGLVELLEAGQVHVHAFVIGELACGNLTQRTKILAALSELPIAPVLDHAQVLEFLEKGRLMGRGLGWVDMSLLASTVHSGLRLWTLDRRLAAVATALDVAMKA